MKKLAKKIDPSILLAFHNLLCAIQSRHAGHTVFLLSHMDMHAYRAMDAYFDAVREWDDDDRDGKAYLKRIRKMQETFAGQKLQSITYGQRLPYPQELKESRRLLRKLMAELQKKGVT